MSAGEFTEYLELVDRARRHWAGRVDVQLGLEADYLPGYERYLEHQLRFAPFQYVIGSVHPHLPEYGRRYADQRPEDQVATYFGLLAECAETKLFDCLAHPDLIKNELADDWRPDDCFDTIRNSLDRIAATGVALELNTSGRYKRIAEMNPFPAMLAAMCERGIPVVVGGDAHCPERVGEGFAEALMQLEAIGYTEVSYFINRERRGVPITAAIESLVDATMMAAV